MARARVMSVVCLACVGLGAAAAHNFCEVANRVDKKEVQPKDALRNSTITFGLPIWSVSSTLVWDRTNYQWKKPRKSNISLTAGADVTGMLEGYQIDVLEELVRHLGFTYEIRLTEGRRPTESLTEWLSRQETSYDYDVLMGNWNDAPKHRVFGFFVPFPLRDYSPVLVTSLHKERPGIWRTLTAFSQPLTPSLWCTMVGITLFTAGVMLWLEAKDGDEAGDEADGEQPELTRSFNGFMKSIWLTFCTVTGAGAHSPTTAGGRLAMWSWSFVVLVFVAAYTANMAMFLVVETASAGSLAGFADARVKRATLCVDRASSTGAALEDFGNGSLAIIDIDPASSSHHSIRHALLNGRCHGFVEGYSMVQKLMAQEEFNKGCKFGIAGEKLREESAGWLIQLLRGDCRHILFQTLGSTLQELELRNVLRKFRRMHLVAIQTMDQDCAAEARSPETDPLGIDSMAGVFLFHGLLISIACVGAKYYHNRQDKGCGEPLVHDGWTSSSGDVPE